jgi:hypothetical protein
MNPLEDIIVAIKAKTPTLGGFGLPLSSRARDPSQPLGTPTGFTQVDPLTGTPATVFNEVSDYGWEYVWHCHILGHEENDFMRPVKFNANEAIPLQPTAMSAVIGDGGTAALTWTDNSVTEYQYLVKRAPVINGNTPNAGSYATISTLLANSHSFTDTPPLKPVNVTNYSYKVTAVGATGSTDSSAVQMTIAAPTSVALVIGAPSTITWLAPSGPAPTNYLVESSQNGGTWKAVGTTVAGSGTLSMALPGSNTLTAGTFTSYQFRVTAQSVSGGVTSKSQPTVLTASLVAPTAVTATLNGKIASIGWTPSASDPVGTTYAPEYRVSNAAGTSFSGWTPVANPNSMTLTVNRSYEFRVSSRIVVVAGTTIAAVSSSKAMGFYVPVAPTNLHLVSAVPGTGSNGATLAQDYVTVSWTAAAMPANPIPVTYTVWFANSAIAAGTYALVPADVTTTSYALSSATKTWYVRIRAESAAGTSTVTTPIAITIP